MQYCNAPARYELNNFGRKRDFNTHRHTQMEKKLKIDKCNSGYHGKEKSNRHKQHMWSF